MKENSQLWRHSMIVFNSQISESGEFQGSGATDDQEAVLKKFDVSLFVPFKHQLEI